MDAPLHILRLGSPDLPLMVWLHGFLGDGRDWVFLSRAFPDHQHWLPDLTGHGQTGIWHHDGGFDALVVALMDEWSAAGNPPMTVIGYSMGGRLALHWAMRHPKNIRRLALLSASAGIATEEARLARRQHDDELASRLLHIHDEAGMARFLEDWYAAPLWQSLHDVYKQNLIEQRRQQNPQALAMGLRAMSIGRQPYHLPDLASFTHPALLMAGAKDPKFVTITQEMQAHWSLAKSVIVSNAGHNLIIECPDLVTDTLKSFFADSLSS